MLAESQRYHPRLELKNDYSWLIGNPDIVEVHFEPYNSTFLNGYTLSGTRLRYKTNSLKEEESFLVERQELRDGDRLVGIDVFDSFGNWEVYMCVSRLDVICKVMDERGTIEVIYENTSLDSSDLNYYFDDLVELPIECGKLKLKSAWYRESDGQSHHISFSQSEKGRLESQDPPFRPLLLEDKDIVVTNYDEDGLAVAQTTYSGAGMGQISIVSLVSDEEQNQTSPKVVRELDTVGDEWVFVDTYYDNGKVKCFRSLDLARYSHGDEVPHGHTVFFDLDSFSKKIHSIWSMHGTARAVMNLGNFDEDDNNWKLKFTTESGFEKHEITMFLFNGEISMFHNAPGKSSPIYEAKSKDVIAFCEDVIADLPNNVLRVVLSDFEKILQNSCIDNEAYRLLTAFQEVLLGLVKKDEFF